MDNRSGVIDFCTTGYIVVPKDGYEVAAAWTGKKSSTLPGGHNENQGDRENSTGDP